MTDPIRDASKLYDVERRVFGCLELLNPTGVEFFGVDALADAEIVANALAERLASPGPIGR